MMKLQGSTAGPILHRQHSPNRSIIRRNFHVQLNLVAITCLQPPFPVRLALIPNMDSKGESEREKVG